MPARTKLSTILQIKAVIVTALKTTKFKGVYQRCNKTCPPRCARHKFSYTIELGKKPDGSPNQITKGGFSSATAANDARTEVRTKYKSGVLAADLKITVCEWLNRWHKNKFALQPSSRTAIAYQQHIDDYLIPHLGKIKLADLSPVHVETMFADIAAARVVEFDKYEQAQRLADRKWIEARKRRKNAKRRKAQAPKSIGPTTFKRIKATLSSALTHALKVAGLISRNVARLVKIPTVPSPKVHPWLPEVYGAFLDAVADHRLAPMFTLAGYGGMRRGELCGLRWEDVDFANARIVVRQQATLVRGKIVYGPVKTASGQDRIVYLAPTALVMLHGLRDQQTIEAAKFGRSYNPLNLVFVQEDGVAWNPDSVTKLFPKIVAEVGFPRCRLHDLRHFYGSTALSAGVPMEVVSKMLGHSSLAITVEIYSHLQPKGGQAAAATIDAAIPRKALTTGGKSGERELGIVDVCGKLLEEEGHTVSRELVTKLVSAVLAHAAAPTPVAA